jgi:hypothetical protein
VTETHLKSLLDQLDKLLPVSREPVDRDDTCVRPSIPAREGDKSAAEQDEMPEQ